MSRYLDLLERTLWTAAQSFLAVWIVTDADPFGPTALKVAGMAAAIAAAKCLLAFQVGAGSTAATLPAGPDTDLGGDGGHADAGTVLAGVVVVALGVVLGTLLLRLL